MRFFDYLKDKITTIILSVLTIVLVEAFLIIFNVNIFLKIYIPLLFALYAGFTIIYNYNRKKYFYNNLIKTLNDLDQKYLITEIVKHSNFLEGEIFLNALYEIDKSMIESINKYKISTQEFREYLELWCHEIKTPIATSKLIIENNQNKITEDILEEQEKIEKLVEQVMFYARSNTLENDYVVKKTNLEDIIQTIIKKHKKELIYKKIKIELEDINIVVNSDSKWLSFIIDQIITNSIKYSKDENPIIKIYTKNNKNNKLLFIEDNGIGINNEEIERVFDKGFTGSNGRLKYNSSGIGLYLCKKLCDKLNHSITLDSKINKKTIVTIVFPDNSLTKVTKK